MGPAGGLCLAAGVAWFRIRRPVPAPHPAAPRARFSVAEHAVAWIAGVLVVAALTTWVDWASGQPRFQPSVSISQEFSDNVDLDAEDEESAFITRVTPALSFRGYTSRFRGGFDGAVGTRYTTS